MARACKERAAERPDHVRERVAIGLEPVQRPRERVQARPRLGAGRSAACESCGQAWNLSEGGGPESLVVQFAELFDREIRDALGEDAQLPRRLARPARTRNGAYCALQLCQMIGSWPLEHRREALDVISGRHGATIAASTRDAYDGGHVDVKRGNSQLPNFQLPSRSRRNLRAAPPELRI